MLQQRVPVRAHTGNDGVPINGRCCFMGDEAIGPRLFHHILQLLVHHMPLGAVEFNNGLFVEFVKLFIAYALPVPDTDLVAGKPHCCPARVR